MKSARGPTEGQASEVRTRFVAMQLDHDSGEMDGTVREGPYAGKRLSALAFADVVSLYRAAAAADQASAQVLQAYLERMHGEAWRDQPDEEAAKAAGGNKSAGGPLTHSEARAILGVGPQATDDEIKQAHRPYLVRDDNGRACIPLRTGAVAWPGEDGLGDVVGELQGVHARLLGRAALLRGKATPRDDPDDAVKDRADFLHLSRIRV
jgi:hypothetical protein